MAAPAPARISVVEPSQPKAQPSVTPRPPEPRPIVRSFRWARIVLVALGILLVLDYGVSEILKSGLLNARLTRRLEAAFGRPVEVSNYTFSLLEGPRLEANYITVDEDPRFGNEYFLRADQLAVGLRWSALLRGRIELGTLSLANPNLNLVHLPDGEWNLESWLPKPPGNAVAATQIAESAKAVKFDRIEISGGRVDFKNGEEKLPFALVSVEGSVEQAALGSWRMDLRAQPFRASAAVQQAGELRLSGSVGGTSSRLRPANLQLAWSDASLSDVLRLARGTDYGVRGTLGFQVAAQTEGPGWKYSSHAELSELHRWDLAPRADDPSASVQADALWVPGKGQLEFTRALVETPHSNVRASGNVEWRFDPSSARVAVKNTQLELTSSGIQLGDLLEWYRAFHAGVDERIALAGVAGVDMAITGWPPRIESGSIATEGATLSGGNLPARFQLGHATVEFSPKMITIPAATIATSDGEQSFRVAGTIGRRTGAQSDWTLEGKSKHVEKLFASAGALGHGLPRGWLADGPAQFRLEWKNAAWPAIRRTQGSIALAGLKIRAPFVNREIAGVRGTVNLSPADLKIQLTSAEAFATNWSGTIDHRYGTRGFQFALAADSLDAAEMDRWLNPQRRQSLLDRVFLFLATAPQTAPVPVWVEGNGTISVGRFALAPLALRQVKADASVAGREVELSNAHAEFYGGAVTGSADLGLTKQPSYDVRGKFQNVDLSQLSARSISLAGLFGGSASGNVQFSAKGLGRDALVHSLECQGEAQVRNAKYLRLDLGESLRAGENVAGTSSFSQASAEFSCANGKVHFTNVTLLEKHQKLVATGDVDSQRRINFEMQSLPTKTAKHTAKQGSDPPPAFRIKGTLKTPEIVRAPERPQN